MEWLTYLLKVTACTVLFFGFYVVVLRKLTFFKINRFYLLVTLLLSFIIPALQLEIKREITVVETEAPVRIPEIKPAAQEPVQLIRPMMLEYQPEVESKIDWMVVMYFIYGGTASLLLLACLWQLLGLLKYTGSYTKNGDGLKLISKTEGFTNCSFFNYVFINHNDLSTADLSVLLKHEQVHVKQYHSIDKIILMVFKAVLWFNPIVYLYDKALEQVHEYEADEITSASFGNRTYASLLLQLAVTKTNNALIHNFLKSPIKDRIKMLFSSKSDNRKKNAYFLVLPMVLSLLWIFAVKFVYAGKQISPESTFQKAQKGFIKPGQSLLDDTINVAKDLRARYAENINMGNAMIGKQLNVKFLGFRDSKKGVLGDISYHNKVYSFDAAINLGKLSAVKIGDSLKIKINGFSVPEPYNEMRLWTNKISTSEGRVLYERPLKKTPFLYGMNGLRFIFSRIANIDQDANHIKRITLKHNSYTIILDVALENFVSNNIRVGDEISVQFIGEKLIAPDTYFSNQVVELHSRQNKYAFKAKTLYTKYQNNNITGITDSIKKVDSPVKPKIISFKKITGDVKHKVSYLENAVIDIVNCRLEAEYVELDQLNGKMIAKNAVLKANEGGSATAKIIIFNLRNGSYSAENSTGATKVSKGLGSDHQMLQRMRDSLTKTDNKVETSVSYSARDSIKMSRDKSIVTLYGKAKLDYKNFSISADEATYNRNTEKITAKNLTLRNKVTGITMLGSYGEFDINGKAEVWQDNK
ncbi:M56 family metallopeptidase [Pedobacter sp. SG918]|uniref:M56 family metallopeptidase n=1 Tax=Pedobacter sp. SG918 TaxID=2587136 RepID=UPI00146CD5CB|nr:M56 family metallopeptidase [Pedobacter sp. SG918]NMN39292.1 hypothetical protein [Pedobacter sp. SG918]